MSKPGPRTQRSGSCSVHSRLPPFFFRANYLFVALLCAGVCVLCTSSRFSGLLFAFVFLPHSQLALVNASKCFISHLHDKHGQCFHPHQTVQETESED